MFLLVLVATCFVTMATTEDDSNVLELDHHHFNDTALDPTKDVLVDFYAPWCPHCQNLAPTYEKVGDMFKMDKNCVVAKVNADAEKKLSAKYGIWRFPTIKFFAKDNKEGEEYTGELSEYDLIDYLNDKCNTDKDLLWVGNLQEKSWH